MTERRTARRYDLSLPVIIRVPAERVSDTQKGKTRDISTRGLYFVLEQDLEAGSELDITLTLPSEITHGSEVFVRALGKVVRVERRMRLEIFARVLQRLRAGPHSFARGHHKQRHVIALAVFRWQYVVAQAQEVPGALPLEPVGVQRLLGSRSEEM